MSTDRKTVVFLGAKSEIAQYLNKRFWSEGWTPEVWARGWPVPDQPWDLCVCAIGQVHPVGMWWEQDEKEWESAIESNLLLPIRLLRSIWPQRKTGASVCFLAGANPNRYMGGYSAYATGKMALLKAVEFLDAESLDTRIFALGPGTILTKIHAVTRKAKWPNPILDREANQNTTEKMERVYQCLKWCISQPKEVIGGRNICASDSWGRDWLTYTLKHNSSVFKLRRIDALFKFGNNE